MQRTPSKFDHIGHNGEREYFDDALRIAVIDIRNYNIITCMLKSAFTNHKKLKLS